MKLMIMPKSTKIRQGNDMLEHYEEIIQSKRPSPIIQFQA